uniref:Myb-like domain-containing protein n=1 Tax=Chromera velia CCMP2878 TaxID=1169474 RepID=A0A0G4H7G2_9ALVE|eukprot:Cvel_24944.t1-p1 / transcript=Cvel_24944.t1 / gene=Cvel_24944 / organism=Chromera_velia_CCMP2878 / gene_product=hypothetical protein / transcript_product=hypothetical protein / location=Cvel_scaffold2760:12706-15869(-) / protein_length=565 / sequence_SO=supercontig / SO=protein_coding / is_pseudo=false
MEQASPLSEESKDALHAALHLYLVSMGHNELAGELYSALDLEHKPASTDYVAKDPHILMRRWLYGERIDAGEQPEAVAGDASSSSQLQQLSSSLRYFQQSGGPGGSSRYTSYGFNKRKWSDEEEGELIMGMSVYPFSWAMIKQLAVDGHLSTLAGFHPSQLRDKWRHLRKRATWDASMQAFRRLQDGESRVGAPCEDEKEKDKQKANGKDGGPVAVTLQGGAFTATQNLSLSEAAQMIVRLREHADFGGGARDDSVGGRAAASVPASSQQHQPASHHFHLGGGGDTPDRHRDGAERGGGHEYDSYEGGAASASAGGGGRLPNGTARAVPFEIDLSEPPKYMGTHSSHFLSVDAGANSSSSSSSAAAAGNSGGRKRTATGAAMGERPSAVSSAFAAGSVDQHRQSGALKLPRPSVNLPGSVAAEGGGVKLEPQPNPNLPLDQTPGLSSDNINGVNGGEFGLPMVFSGSLHADPSGFAPAPQPPEQLHAANLDHSSHHPSHSASSSASAHGGGHRRQSGGDSWGGLSRQGSSSRGGSGGGGVHGHGGSGGMRESGYSGGGGAFLSLG